VVALKIFVSMILSEIGPARRLLILFPERCRLRENRCGLSPALSCYTSMGKEILMRSGNSAFWTHAEAEKNLEASGFKIRVIKNVVTKGCVR